MSVKVDDHMQKMLDDARALVEAMTPEEYAEMLEKQKQSWVRGMMAKCEHGKLDFEQCPKCRGWE